MSRAIFCNEGKECEEFSPFGRILLTERRIRFFPGVLPQLVLFFRFHPEVSTLELLSNYAGRLRSIRNILLLKKRTQAKHEILLIVYLSHLQAILLKNCGMPNCL